MSSLGSTLVAVSLLASVGCGTAIAMIVAYRTEWKPLIAALTRRCELLEQEVRDAHKAADLWAEKAIVYWAEDRS